MRRTTAWIVAVVAAAASVLGATLPWARYGDIGIPLTRFPGWPAWIVAALALHGLVAAVLLSRSARRPVTAAVACLLAVGVAGYTAWLQGRYGDAGLFFDDVVPAVMPRPGPGGIIAVVAAVASGAVAVVVAFRGLRRAEPDAAGDIVPARG